MYYRNSFPLSDRLSVVTRATSYLFNPLTPTVTI